MSATLPGKGLGEGGRVAGDPIHPETIFPDHADSVIAWRQSLGEPATQKLMWENATRFFRLTSMPW